MSRSRHEFDLSGTTNLERLWDNPGQTIPGTTDRDKKLVPFWSLDLNDHAKLSEWKRIFQHKTTREMEVRAEHWVDNLRMYIGQHFEQSHQKRSRTNTESETVRTKRKPFPINITNELVEQKNSKITANKVGIKAIPPNNAPHSRNNSRVAEKFIKYYQYVNSTDTLWERWQRATFVFGECGMQVEWNAAKGPIDPEFEGLIDDLFDKAEEEDTNPEPAREVIARDTDDNDRPIYASKVRYQGDPELKIKWPWQLRWEIGKEWEDADYKMVEDRWYLDSVLAKYGDVSPIEDENGEAVELSDLVEEDGRIPVFTLYHVETEYLALGRKVVFVGDTVVENTIHPHNKDKVPVTLLTDIDIPSEKRAKSFIENVKQLNRAYDGVMFLMLKALAHAAHPKWLMPRKAASHVNLAGLATIVEYTGQVPPRLETFSVLKPEMFQILDLLLKQMRENAGVQPVSFGDVPKRLDSSIAIQQLEEQETKRDGTAILKFRNGILDVWQNLMDIVGKHYDENTDRIIKVIGQDESIDVETIKGSDLTGPFELRIVSTSALPETLSGKTEFLIQFKKEFPGLVPDAFVLDALDMSQPDRYVSHAVAAIRKAEMENEDMLSEIEVANPEAYEDLVAHWQTHMRLVQTRKFQNSTDTVKDRVLSHLGQTEMLMHERTVPITGRGFSAKLQALDGWPSVYKVPEPPQQQAPAGAGVPLQEGNAAQQSQPQGPQVVAGQQPVEAQQQTQQPPEG